MEQKFYDLNVFYQELFDEESESYMWSDNLFIQPYLYIEDFQGSRRYEGPLFELSEEESLIISPEYPDNEFGTDWWVGLEEFIKQHPAMPYRVMNFLISLPDPDKANPIEEPTWWIAQTKTDDMLF